MSDKVKVCMAAIEKTLETYIPSFEEKEGRGKEYVIWGEDNKFPSYLYDLYTNVTTLRSIINGTTDFVCGDDIIANIDALKIEVNKSGDTLNELIADLSKNYLTYGNAFIHIIRNKAGQVSELYSLNPKYVRTDKKNNLFWYSEDFGKQYTRTSKKLTYPKFLNEATDVASSVLMLKTENDKTYGLPLFIASLKDCEVEKKISEFNLSLLDNGFYGSYLFDFHNGIPTDEQKAEIEKSISEKFCGSSNAGRVILNFSDGKDNGVTLSKMDIVNYAEKYNTTDQRASKKIYEAFGASPVLFGVEKETTGFNSEDYEQAFKLYNKVRVSPIQKKIVDSLNKIFKVDNSIEIAPFKIVWGTNNDNKRNII